MKIRMRFIACLLYGIIDPPAHHHGSLVHRAKTAPLVLLFIVSIVQLRDNAVQRKKKEQGGSNSENTGMIEGAY
jgi:hypothetical protein